MKTHHLGLLALALQAAHAQAADSTTLPLAPTPFKGVIDTTYKTSRPDFPAQLKAPKGAPNVLLVLLDDIGFAGTGTFGGQIDTPQLDQLAHEGLRYNRFHTTALCSPTRSALLTGRNHHEVGNGMITELAVGYPGYNSQWAQDSASIAEVLKDNGYSTAMFGKWHNTPDWETSPAGPFDRWPTGKGFQYFYGFLGGETSQWEPQLYQNTQPVEPATRPEQGYHLTSDLADRAINYIHTQASVAPDKPWFIYWAPGAAHAPHHAPQAYIDKYKGKFDAGWDAYREAAFAKQKALGIIPADARLTPRPAELPAWDSMTADQKRLFARQMEVYAGFVDHTDHEAGRLMTAARQMPNGDNTLIIFITGDNGGSAEGSMIGTLNNMATQNGIPDSVEGQLAVLDELGGPKHENHFAVPWAWAIDTPFQWMKQVGSHLGGVRNGMVISWPAHIKQPGGVRSQFTHVVDIAPTLYEAIGVQTPEVVNGAQQKPINGVSLLYSLDDAKAADRHTTQYFEMFGNRSIYHDGWLAAARHGLPWELVNRNKGFEEDRWELYDLNTDYSQSIDLADKYPEKLKELQALFDQQARENQVYPLDDRWVERALDPLRPSLTRGRTEFSFYQGTVRIPEGSAPNTKRRSHRISTRIVVPAGGVEGVIAAQGGSSGGWSLYVKDNRLVYVNNFFGKHSDVLAAAEPLPVGEVEVAFEYTQQSKEWGGGGVGRLLINGEEVASGTFAHVVPGRFSATETLDIGEELGSTVSADYHAPNRFTSTMAPVRFELR
ncbi:arylsulfatase [Pseudomonas fontis]|uniref:Arylsulfatase n=1 Tax=Pseudomonas fontis TaxID=2942633 RepID=A0ABT5NY88_9PSED|nr:arylsulfatase [Pseudomonas fontis]MDD0972524.1 arylsulfatase [Pseudomonas fontis]MDD0993048.1 arylsulfatase [Pseudomonas fontis]